MWVAGGTAIVASLLGGAMAIWFTGVPRATSRWIVGMAVLVLALPPFLVTNAWLELVGQGGAWRSWLPFDLYSLSGTVWVLTLLYWPVPFLFVLGVWPRLQPSQVEADPELRGGNLIRWLLIPAARPALLQAAGVTFILAWNNFSVPAILQTKVFPAELWVSFNTTFDYAKAVRLSWPLVLFTGIGLGWLRGMRLTWPRTEPKVAPALLRARLGPGWWGGLAALTGAVLGLSFLVPISELVAAKRTWAELPDAFKAGQLAMWNSLRFALTTTVLALGASLLALRFRGAVVLWIPFLLPGVLVGIGLIYLLNREPWIALYQSSTIVLVALSLRYGVLSWSGLREARRACDPHWEDFVRLQTGSRWQRFRIGAWPQLAPALGGLGLMTYLLCLWDVETVLLIVPPGCETLALRIFNLLHYGHNSQVNALCILLLALAALPAALWALALSGRRAALGGIRRTAAVFLIVLSLGAAGCQPGSPDQTAIQSKFFSRVEVVGSRGTALGQFNKPRSLALDLKDQLYVVDMTGRVQRFGTNGVFLGAWQMPETDKGKPKGMCRDAKGNIVVVEPHYTRVNHFSPEGKLLAQWGHSGTNAGQLCLPRAVAVDSRGEIFVCEYTLVDRVQRFSSDGAEAQIVFGRSGREPGELNRPEGLAIGPGDEVFVADSCNHRIQVFSREGKFLRSYGHAGNGAGELSYPYDVQVDEAGFQFVAEFGNSRVQVFDPRGVSVEIIGGIGAAPGRFSNPWSLALDSAGNLYVADSQNHRVQKFVRKPGYHHSEKAAARLDDNEFAGIDSRVRIADGDSQRRVASP